jgi:3-sulfinopropanoyl-CoA desulfinase
VVETNMGALSCILAYGSLGQQRETARRILEEGDKPAIGMTEPDAGTDLGALKTTAAERGGSYVLNGTKHWIAGGGISLAKDHLRRLADGRVRVELKRAWSGGTTYLRFEPLEFLD